MTSSAGHWRHEINRAANAGWHASLGRFRPPLPGELRVVGVGRAYAPQVRRARAPAGRAPTSRSRSRAIAGRERNTVPEDGAPRAESDGMVFPMPARTVTGKNRLLWYITDLLQPTLPRGFNSWTQVLSDWAVSRVWLAAKVPPCLTARPELAAPFVTEIGAAIRQRQLHRWVGRLDFAQQQVTEPAFDEAGGPAYQALRDEMESAQQAYFSARCAQRSRGADESETVMTLRSKMEQLQADFDKTRGRHESHVEKIRRETAKAFWATRNPCVITDTYFADEPIHATTARLARIHPPWWGAFHRRLQQSFAHGHPAEGYLHDALPGLRRQVTKRSKLKLEGTVALWWETNQQRWGWYAKTEPHYRMLSKRTRKKTRELIRWFNSTAPGYLSDQTVRVSLHAALTERLREADPWSVPAPDSRSMLAWSEHGLN
jgi:hypothetical protein